MKRVMVYKRFERFWHWLQTTLIITLAITGYNIHYTDCNLMSFDQAHTIHTICALTLIALVALSVFWHFTTGEWKQYIPTKKHLFSMMQFYALGIFKNAPHPVKKTLISKLNPLQRLTYLGLHIIIIPIMATTGLILFFYNELSNAGYSVNFAVVATVHTIGTFILVSFMIIHIYLTTTGHTLTSNIKAMITGYEELEDK